jgi:hypothetical protein
LNTFAFTTYLTIPGVMFVEDYLCYTVVDNAMKDKIKDQQGKGNVHMTQPPTHQSKAPRRHQTKTWSEHKGGERRGTCNAKMKPWIKIEWHPYTVVIVVFCSSFFGISL